MVSTDLFLVKFISVHTTCIHTSCCVSVVYKMLIGRLCKSVNVTEIFFVTMLVVGIVLLILLAVHARDDE